MTGSDTVPGTVIAKLDQVIISLLQEREHLVALARGPTIEADEGFNPPAPFSRPLTTTNLERVKPFEPLAKGFWIGFEREGGAAITVRQKPKDDPFLSPPDHHYSLEIEIIDPGAAKWMTVEWQVGRIPAVGPSLLTVGLKAMAARPESVRLELSLPMTSGPQKRISLGILQLKETFDFVSLSKRIAREDLEGVDLTKLATVLMFLPVASFRMEIAFLRVFLSPAAT